MSGFTAIINGVAGGGRAAGLAPEALGRLRSHGWVIDERWTERPGHGSELARDAYARGTRNFLCVGGDGTAYELVNGLFPRPAGDTGPITVAFLPLGTGNSFLRDFGLTDAAGALDAALSGRRRAVDVLRCEHREGSLYSLNLISVGFSADVCALTNRRFKPLGYAGYGLAVVVRVVGLSHPRFPLVIDGEPDDRPCVLLSFSNSKFTGGTMMMAPDADPGDGQMDVIRVGPLSRWGLLRAFPKLYKGTHLSLPAIDARRAREVRFVGGATVDLMIDGEVVTATPERLSVLPGALEVLA